MRAICKERAAPGASVIAAPMPQATDGLVLVRVKAASICGTDVHIYKWDEWAAKRIQPPLIFGHEFSGEVVEVGPGVTQVRPGDHISSETHIPCGACALCRGGRMHLCHRVVLVGVDRPGGFAEYVALPEICCVKNDRTLPWDIASIQEPFGNAVYCVSEGEVQGKTVAVFGDGPIGIFAVAVARAHGAKQIIAVGMQPYRLKLLALFKPDHLLDASQVNVVEAIMELTQGEGVDVVLEMSGSQKAIHHGFAVVRPGGIFTAFGIPSRPVEIHFADEIIFKGITVKAIFGRKMFETWDEVHALLESGRVDLRPLITHTFPFDKIDAAMALLSGDDIRAGKIVLTP